MTNQTAKHRRLSKPAKSPPITLTCHVSGLIRLLGRGPGYEIIELEESNKHNSFCKLTKRSATMDVKYVLLNVYNLSIYIHI